MSSVQHFDDGLNSIETERQFNIGAIKIEPRFHYRVSNINFSVQFNRQGNGTHCNPTLYFFTLRREQWAADIINNLSANAGYADYSYNNIASNADLSIQAQDLLFNPPATGTGAPSPNIGTDNFIALSNNTIGTRRVCWSDAFTVNLYATAVVPFGLTQLGGGSEEIAPIAFQTIRDFHFYNGQYGHLYFLIFHDTIDNYPVDNAKGKTFTTYGNLNFDLIQQPPEDV